MVNDFPVLSAGPKPTAPLDQWTLHHPAEDRKLFGDRFAQAIAKVVSAYGTAADPETYGHAVADKLLPNVLPYTVGTQAVFGYGLWNGRSLTDSART